MNKWISVKERLPETSGNYLCYIKYSFTKVRLERVYLFLHETNNFVLEWPGEIVTHWMPLPELPEEE